METEPHDESYEKDHDSYDEYRSYERTIEASASDVWGFIIDPAALSAWFGADAWLEPVEGSAVLFRFFDGSVRRGVIERVQPFRRLVWRWREHRGAGFGSSIGEMSTVAVELEPVPTGTRVRITERPLGTAAAVSRGDG
jgi:uncharacterized protein YndB with AHSA1/START domain